jgi:hypothetical protein
VADETTRIRVQCTLDMPEGLFFPFLRLIRRWEADQQDVHVRIGTTTPVSYTTEELAAMLRRLEPPLTQIRTVTREDGDA